MLNHICQLEYIVFQIASGMRFAMFRVFDQEIGIVEKCWDVAKLLRFCIGSRSYYASNTPPPRGEVRTIFQVRAHKFDCWVPVRCPAPKACVRANKNKTLAQKKTWRIARIKNILGASRRPTSPAHVLIVVGGPEPWAAAKHWPPQLTDIKHWLFSAPQETVRTRTGRKHGPAGCSHGKKHLLFLAPQETVRTVDGT